MCHVNELNKARSEGHKSIPHDARAGPSEFVVALAGFCQGAETAAAKGVQNKFKGVRSGHSFRGCFAFEHGQN